MYPPSRETDDPMAGTAGSILVEFISPAIKELAPLHTTHTQGLLEI